MADQCGQKTLEHRSQFIENSVQDKLQFVECAVAVKGINNEKNNMDGWIAEFFGNMDWSAYKELSLRSKELTHLPRDFGVYMNNLMSLDLSFNKLTTVPYSLKFIAKMETLLLDHNCLRNLSLTIMELSCLRVLQLSNNSIEILPAKLGEIISLETLILSSNRLSDLPESCNNLSQLKILDLSDNCFKKLPSCLEDLESLETLILRSNQVAKLPESFSRLNRVKTLDLSYNSFKQFPCCVTKGMRSLETLNVSHNKYINVTTAPASEKLKKLYIREVGAQSKFPLWLFSGLAPMLELLDLEGTKFKVFKVPDNCPRLNIKKLLLQRCSFYDSFIRDLTERTDQLECLKLGNGNSKRSGNAFWVMPIENLKHPELVTEIDLRATGLPIVSQAIERFVNLLKLDIGHNNINWLCNEICSLKKLKILLIDENDLSCLPNNIGHMIALEELKANDNYLNCIPDSVRDLKQLTYLDLHNNDFSEIPTELHYMNNLLGLDVDQNSFTINDGDCISDTPYETLREVVRKRYWNYHDDIRRTGPRYETDPGEESDTSSENSSITCYDWKATVEENANSTEQLEEDWDNSADEFDPDHAVVQTSMRQWSIVERERAMGLRTAFCPDDLHAKSVRKQIAQMRANGIITDQFIIEEGQFEDA